MCEAGASTKGQCRPCYERVWRAANKERIQEQKRREYEADREVVKARTEARRQANLDRHRQYQKTYRDKTATPRVLLTREEKLIRKRATEARRRARIANAPINDFTVEQWIEVLDEHGHRCFYCGDVDAPLQQEHKTPLSRNGSHTKLNIVPACGPCNSSKRDRTAEEFMEALSA